MMDNIQEIIKYVNDNHAKILDDIKGAKVISYFYILPYKYIVFHFSNGKWILVLYVTGDSILEIWKGDFGDSLKRGSEMWRLAESMYILPGQEIPRIGGVDD